MMLQKASLTLFLIAAIFLSQLTWAGETCPKNLKSVLANNISKIGSYADSFDKTDTATLVNEFETIQNSLNQYPIACFESENITLETSDLAKKRSKFAADLSARISFDIARKKNFVDVTKDIALLERLSASTKTKITINKEAVIELSKKNQLAEKASCPSQDLRKNLKEVLGPIQDQGQKGWCYAFQSAAMLSSHYGQTISATAFAVQFNINKIGDHPELKNEKPFLMLSHAKDDYMESILDHHSSVCLESQVASNFHAIKKIENIYTPVTFQNDSLTMCAGAGKIFPELTRNNLGGVYNSLDNDERSSPRLQTQAQMKKACSKGIDTSGISIQKDSEFGSDEQALQKKMLMFKDIDGILSKKKPVALNMDGCILGDSKYQPQPVDPNAVNCYHAVVVVGSRYNDKSNQCEYLIRNSWGEDGDWGNGLDKTRDGHAWVSKETIAKGRMTAWWLNDK